MSIWLARNAYNWHELQFNILDWFSFTLFCTVRAWYRFDWSSIITFFVGLLLELFASVCEVSLVFLLFRTYFVYAAKNGTVCYWWYCRYFCHICYEKLLTKYICSVYNDENAFSCVCCDMLLSGYYVYTHCIPEVTKCLNWPLYKALWAFICNKTTQIEVVLIYN